jgi:hypothetical protein
MILRKPLLYIGKLGGGNLRRIVKVESALAGFPGPLGKLLFFFPAAVAMAPPTQSPLSVKSLGPSGIRLAASRIASGGRGSTFQR